MIIFQRVLWKLWHDVFKKGLGILLNGKCAKCGRDVCGVIEE